MPTLPPDLSGVFASMWGDVRPTEAPYLEGKVWSEQSPTVAATTFHLDIQVRDHDRLVMGYRYHVDGARVGSRHVVSDREIAIMRASSSKLMEDILERMFEESSPLLFEWDPRVGFTIEHPDAPGLPRCPLFDPIPRTIPLWDYGTMVTSMQTPCPFCGESFTIEHPPMWGGGNVGWVHTDCWGEGLARDPLWGGVTGAVAT